MSLLLSIKYLVDARTHIFGETFRLQIFQTRKSEESFLNRRAYHKSWSLIARNDNALSHDARVNKFFHILVKLPHGDFAHAFLNSWVYFCFHTPMRILLLDALSSKLSRKLSHV